MISNLAVRPPRMLRILLLTGFCEQSQSHHMQVASYMRAVLKTLAQCHVHNILHRDIKPGNFMLVSKAEDARIKAIDFGLAVPFKDGDDLTDLSMQGTPWCVALISERHPL
jgi:serine/threonine protein kinase